MKNLIILSFLLMGSGCKAQKDSCYKPLRSFYYSWSYWTPSSNGWGENNIKLNHYPTKSEIRKRVAKMFGMSQKKASILVIEITEVTEEELSELYQRSGIERIPETILQHINL